MGSAPHSSSAAILRGRRRAQPLGAIVVAALLAGASCTQPPPPKPAAAPIDYADPASWICRPGVDDGSCSTNLDAVTIDSTGRRTPRPFRPDPNPAIDCFYVYPTGSDDAGFYSDMHADRSETRLVHGQAARLREHCRLFAPIYRQMTLAGLRQTVGADGAVAGDGGGRLLDPPYRDVLAAWRSYLARDNNGRGVVLVGHSQGAILLKRLLAEEIDGRPVQARLVGAYLAGNLDLTTASFRALKPCARVGEIGCITAWSSYAEGDAAKRTFGGGAGAICVDPGAPAGGRGSLDAFLPRPSFAPESDPPYIEVVGQLSAACVRDGQGQVLRVRAEPGRYHDLLAATLQASGRPGWGLHALDISLAQGSMLTLIGAQAASWSTKPHRASNARAAGRGD